jgi:hypothetical protein
MIRGAGAISAGEKAASVLTLSYFTSPCPGTQRWSQLVV